MEGAKNGSTIEVAHEALFREWDRLRDWLEPQLRTNETELAKSAPKGQMRSLDEAQPYNCSTCLTAIYASSQSLLPCSATKPPMPR